MKFSCSALDFARALVTAERFIGKNLTLPILANILLEVEGNTLRATATNLEYAIQLEIDGHGSGDGRVCVPAKVVSSLAQSLQEGEVRLEGRQGNLEVHATSRQTELNGMSADDFPLMPHITETASFILNGFEFRRGLERVLPAVSLSEFKPELAGVYCKITPHEGRCAATDTFRLAEQLIGPGKGLKETVSFILPHRLAQELARALGNTEEISFSLGENQIVCEFARMKIVSRLVDGVFPEYQAIIPRRLDTSCFLKRGELLAAVRASSIFASKLRDIGMRVGQKEIEVSAANTEVGRFKTEVAAAVTGAPASLTFNYRYLIDGLNVLDEDECYVGISTEHAPSLIRNRHDASFTYVVMPIRLS